MRVIRALIAAGSIAGVLGVLASVLRTVVLPRGVPARLARFAFLSVRWLLLLRLRLTRGRDYRTLDRVFALQAPLGLFGQLVLWGFILLALFSAIFWSLSGDPLTGSALRNAVELAGSSMLTLGFDRPNGLALQFTAFSAAAVGLALLALVITYLPSVYNAFSRREATIMKLVVRTRQPPSGPALLSRSWQLERFDRLEEVWNGWEEWFIDVGETHTTFPQLAFFRSPHPENHWVLAAEAVLDGAALMTTACDAERQSRAELCLDAGVMALIAIADFLGIPHSPPEDDAEILLRREQFDETWRELDGLGVPLRDDAGEAWVDFRQARARYEPLIAVLGRMTDAPRSEWSAWSEDTPRHSPPLLRVHVRRSDP